MNGRDAARSGEWAQHFLNASCVGLFTPGPVNKLLLLSIFLASVASDICPCFLLAAHPSTVEKRKPFPGGLLNANATV